MVKERKPREIIIRQIKEERPDVLTVYIYLLYNEVELTNALPLTRIRLGIHV